MELPEKFTEALDEDLAAYSVQGTYYLDESYILEVGWKYSLFPTRLDFVLEYAARIRGKEELSLLSFLARRLILRKPETEYIAFPRVPAEINADRAAEIEMCAFFALLSFAEATVDFALRAGMPGKVARDTADVFEAYLEISEKRLKRKGFLASTYYSWNQRYINHHIFRVGILNYEVVDSLNAGAVLYTDGMEYTVLMNGKQISRDGRIAGSAGYSDVLYTADIKETDEYYEGYSVDPFRARVIPAAVRLARPEWRVAVGDGDAVLNVHIPSGAKLTRENIDKANSDALKYIGAAFPRLDFKAVYCISWLLDPTLSDLLPEGSGIRRFQSDYLRFPTASLGQAVFTFLFDLTAPPAELSALPEDTSLQRAVKRHYLEGRYIYEVAGFIPKK